MKFRFRFRNGYGNIFSIIKVQCIEKISSTERQYQIRPRKRHQIKAFIKV